MFKRNQNRRCYALFAVILFILSACSTTKYENLHIIDENNRAAIRREDVEYDFYGFVGNAKLTGKQIGIVDGDRNHKVYLVKGYDDTDWLLTELDVIMDRGIYSLYKAQHVQEIPDDFALDDDPDVHFLKNYQ